LKIDTPDNIIKQYNNKLLSVKSDNMALLLKDLRSNKSTSNCFAFGDKHHVSVDDEQFKTENLALFLKEKGHSNIEISEIVPTVEDCFMELSQI
jgi:hypothetical protein